MKQKFNFVSACAGSGKTTTAMAAMAKGIALGERYVVAQPTKQLIESTVANQRNKLALGSAKIAVVTADHFPGSTHSAFITAITDKTADIIFTTHSTIMACWEIAGKSGWNLIIDEVPSVDVPFNANLSMTWDHWVQHLWLADADDADALTVAIKPNSMQLAQAYADNETQDQVIKVTQSFWEMAVNPNYRLSMTKADWQTAGFAGKCQLHAHGTLLPSIFNNWKNVTFMGANFEHSLMYVVWTAMGIEFEADRTITVKNAVHSAVTGARARIHYFTERQWSIYLRDKIGFTRLSAKLAEHIDREHIWTANNDVEDYQWKAKHGTRLKPISHGLNNYIDFDCAVFLAALNDTPAHGKWLQNTYGLDRTEIGKAKALEAAYQMVMRTNLRLENGTKDVDIYVADRRTADYICSLLPGSKLHFLDLGLRELGNSGRNLAQLKPTKTAAERMKADRDKKQGLIENLLSLCEALMGLQNVLRTSDISPMLTFSASIFTSHVETEQMRSFDEVKALLETMYQCRFKTKDENLLITGATFSPDANSESQRGLDVFVMSQVLQFDIDDGELPPQLLSKLFSDVKHVAYNSFNNGRDGLFRYRVFIPLNRPVTKDAYEMLWDAMASRIEEAGYTIGKNRKGPHSGLDTSKRTPVSLMYAPCQANEKKHSFWIDNWNVPLLDVIAMINRAPAETPEYVEVQAVDNRSPEVRAVLDAINKPRNMNSAAFDAETEQRRKQGFADKLAKRWMTEPDAGNLLSGMIPQWLADKGFSRDEINAWYFDNFNNRPNSNKHKTNWDNMVRKHAK